MSITWWGALALSVVGLLSLFMFIAIGMAVSDSAAWLFLLSVVAFTALIWAGIYWAVPRRKND